MKDVSDKTIKNYILGKCTPGELSRLAEWVGQSAEHAERLFRLTELYHTGRVMLQHDVQRTMRAELSLMRRVAEAEAEERRCRRMRLWQRASAAVFVFLVATAGMLYWLRQEKAMMVVATTDRIKHVVLPDSSEVWLNTASTLKYPKDFDGRLRQVELDGEACFDVSKDEHRPFIVKSKWLTTRVLGTVFNFKTRASDNTAEVALLEGSVRVRGNHDEGQITIHPNQKAVLDKSSGQMEVVQMYAPLAAAWRTHTIPFANMRLTEIASALEAYYQVRIDVCPALIRRNTYSGVVSCRSTIDSVLVDLSYSVPFAFKRSGSHVVLSPRK